jgi:hypothetical protein
MIDKPSEKEDEYFKREELTTIKRMREDAASKLQVEERERLKKLHWLRCPKCGMEMTEIDYRDVEVDACFACGGMYFDKGEVEKLLEDERQQPGFLGRMVSNLFGR